jgi:hypothetical protein
MSRRPARSSKPPPGATASLVRAIGGAARSASDARAAAVVAALAPWAGGTPAPRLSPGERSARLQAARIAVRLDPPQWDLAAAVLAPPRRAALPRGVRVATPARPKSKLRPKARPKPKAKAQKPRR